MKNLNLKVHSWHDYELIDSGDNRKLERFGQFIVIRPETQALWGPARPEDWKRANGEFKTSAKGGAWVNKKNLPEAWGMQWNQARFEIRPTNFKHVGVFPEQAANWEWIAERVMAVKQHAAGKNNDGPSPKILNLFGYTGVASIVAAHAGAQVTHVDASRQSNEWAKVNAKLSEVASESTKDFGSIRYILDDALKFVEREVRRGAVYDGVILDPPAFGRGAKGEVWKIEEKLPALLAVLEKILSKKPGAFFLLNGYAAGYSPQSFEQATEGAFPEVKKISSAEFGELQIFESGGDGKDGRCVPSGIYIRFVR